MKRLMVLFVLVFSLAGCSQLKGWLDAPATPEVVQAAAEGGNAAVVKGLLGSLVETILMPTTLAGGALGALLYPAAVRPLRRRREASKAKPS